jgi:hypothetical protein
MNIYHPYEVLADTDDCLHLKEGESREKFQFITSRVVPVFLIMLLWFVLQQVGASIPMGWIYVLAGITLLTAGLLFFRYYITELKIVKQKDVFIVLKTVFGNREKSIHIADIKKISLLRKKGKSKAAFFAITTATDKSYLLLNIPSANIDEHHLRLIQERLEDLLQLTITAK